MNSSALAIIIPAYKPDFLRETLASIQAQTDQRFHVYVGDDQSPYDIESIVNEFKGAIPISYIRFPDNLGSRNLISQWNRCLDLGQNDEWIWLFSDDDIMSPTCVEQFYKALATTANFYDLYHFDVDVIDQNHKRLHAAKPFSKPLSTVEYFERRVGSFIVEFIFNKDHFKRCGGFVEFDLAWNADHATWISLSYPKGIWTIPDAKVFWRFSQANISSRTSDRNLSLRKCEADLQFYQWVSQFFATRNLKPSSPQLQLAKDYQRSLLQYRNSLSSAELWAFHDRFVKQSNLIHCKVFAKLQFFCLSNYMKWKTRLLSKARKS